MENIFENDVVYNLLWEDERRPRVIQERESYFETLDDMDFIRFRLSKTTALSVLSMIEDKLEFPYDKNDSIAPIDQLLTTLRFYATNFDYLTAGDYGGFSKSTAFRIVQRVSIAIARLLPQFVSFPETDHHIMKTKRDFFGIASFPNVIGAIDCTHVRIRSPGGDTAELFRNRKSYFSLNVQAICNANMEFADLVARWPGSSHDSTIFNHSYTKSRFEAGMFGDCYLLGDAGYACSQYLLTPLEKPVHQAEHLYNEAHIRTRNVIERTFRVWKRRFPVLALGLRLSLENIFPVIVATAALHNILRKAGEEDMPPDDPELHFPAPWEILLNVGDMNETIAGPQRTHRREFEKRNALVTNYFRSIAARYQRRL